MRVMITTPALNAMEGHGLTDAALIVDDRRVAVAYSVFSPATSRYSLVTLDGRWIIPGKEGYKTRGPASTFARKNIADMRPDGMVILEPVRHNGRYAMTRYGQRRSGICRGTVSMDRYGYKCTCGETLSFSDIHRPGWTIVTDGRRGTHTQAYAVRSSDAVEWSADVPMSCDAPVVVGGPEVPAPVEAPAPAPVEAPAEVPAPAPLEATTADGKALPFGTYRPNVPGTRTLRDARPLVIGGRTITAVVKSSGWTLFAGGEILATGDAREISGDACEWFAARAMAETAETARPGVVWEREGNGAYGAKRHVVTIDGRWSFRVDVTGPDRNGLETFSAPLLLVAGRDKGVKVPTIQVADFQTYERGACEADIQAWLNREVRARETRHAELHAAGKTPRPAEYRSVCGECRIKAPGKTRCDCTGGKTWAAGERDRADMARVFKATRKASDARAAGKDAPAGFFGWSIPTRTAEWTPEGYAPGVMLAWDVEGVAFTGQVWANDVITGEWSGSSYAGSADACVIIATVDGVRATRDQAVAVPMWFGSKHGTPYARVSVPNGTDEDGKARRFTADVTVIATECASEGLFPVESVEESAPEENAPENDAETSAPVDPGYSLDVAEGERVFTRPGFADGGSYKGRAAVLRGVVTVADARAAVERFPATLRTSGGAVVDGAIVPMGCAMLRARATVRTDAGYAVTLPDGTTVTGTWVECGNAFAEWAITKRPEFVCATAEGHADGAATLARIGAEVRAEREQGEAEAAQAAADLDTVAADLERVWSVWSPYLADLTDEDEERVYGVDAGARTALRYARAAVERNDSGAVVHFVNEAREGVEWLAESARRSGLDVPDAPAEVPVPVAAPVRALSDIDSAPDAIEAWEGEGGAIPGVAAPPPAPEGEPSDGDATADAAESGAYAAETAPESATSRGFDANASDEAHAPGGEGGFCRELDAYVSKMVPQGIEPAGGAAECGDEQMKEAAGVAEAETCEACGRERHPDTALYVGACRPQSWTYCSRANTGQGAIIPTGVQEEAAAADPGAVEAAADGEGQEVSEESADIVIRHTPAEGTTVEGTSRGDKAGAILRRKEYGRRGGMAFRWGYDMQAWYLRNSRDGDADMWTVRKLRGYLEEAGYTVAVVIDNDAERAYADAVQEQYDRAGDRAERYSGYAANASARSEGAWKASHAIADHMTGEPIKVGHHSERRHRRDIERMDGHMRRSIEEQNKAAYHARRAISAEHFEEFKQNPARTLRRLDGPEGLRKQLRDVDKWAAGESACGYTRSTTAEGLETLARERRRIVEKIAYWESVIAEAEAAGFKVWGPADFAKGDFVHTGGTWRQVLRVNKKSLTVPHILTRTGVPVVRSEDRTCTAGTVFYGRPSPCKGGGRCTCDTSTITYDTVQGWASAADIARMEAAEAEPEAERTVCPHCKRVANGEKRFSTARGMCTVCGYARPQNFKPKPVPVVVEGQAEEEPTEVADTAEISGEGSPAEDGQGFEAADDPAQIDELPEPAPERPARPAAPAPVAVPELEPADDPAQIDDMPDPAPECGRPRAFGDMVAVFMASQGGSPARQRVLWWMPRRDAQAVCSDARTSGARFMLCWTAEPGEHGTDWDFVTDDGRFGEVLRDVYARPVTAEGYAERRPGTCHPERWCGHAWPCGRDEEAWQARQPKSRAQLRREAQAEARAAKAAPPAPVRAAAPVGGPLSRRGGTRGVEGVRTGHSARQGTLPQGRDANTSRRAIPVGEGGFSAELDANTSNMGVGSAFTPDVISDPAAPVVPVVHKTRTVSGSTETTGHGHEGTHYAYGYTVYCTCGRSIWEPSQGSARLRAKAHRQGRDPWPAPVAVTSDPGSGAQNPGAAAGEPCEDFAPTDNDQAAAPAYAADVVSDPSGVEVFDGEGGAPVEAPRTEVQALTARIMDEMRAAEVVPALGWSHAMADVVAYAAAGELYADGVGGFRRGENVGARRVDRERVRLLLGGGFLKAPAAARPGPVECTADGREALRLVALNPAGLRPAGEAMAAVRRAKRARQWMSPERQAANALTPLPNGEEVARRRAVAAERMAEWDRQAAARRAETDAVLARTAERDAEERRQAETRRAAEAAPCADCAEVYPVEARCGECRDRAAAGLPLVDVPRHVANEQVTERRALPASPVRKALEAGEREPIVPPHVPAPRVFEVAPVESPEVRQVRALVARLRAADDVEAVEEQAARNWFEAAVEPVAVVEDQEEHQEHDAPVLSWDEIAEELRELQAELKGDGQTPEDGPSLTWDEVRRELVALRREISPARPEALPVRPVRIPRRLRREALTIAASAALVTVAAGQVAEMMSYRW